MAAGHDESTCPLHSVHRRLEDAHQLWHRALVDYFEPERFRASVQNCIQTLRTVTWLLQSQKAIFQNFDEWYSEWQARMRADPVMRWLVEARNHIEKVGDLESASTVRAQIIASYLQAQPVTNVSANLREGIQDIFARVPSAVLQRQILEHGTLKIERRWVANNLPEHELLDALAHVYGVVSLLLDDAHRQLGLPIPTAMVLGKDGPIPFPGGGPRDGRLPCMVGIDSQRSIHMALKTGERVELYAEPRWPREEDLEKSSKRYGPPEEIPRIDDNPTPDSMARWYFAMARRVFLKDSYHSPMAFLLRDGAPLVHLQLEFSDRRTKYMMMRLIATEVERHNADSVILIGEIWVAAPNPDDPLQYAADSESKTERLALHMCAKDQEIFSIYAEILRDGDRVHLDETVEQRGGEAWMFEPVREVWKRIGP